MDMEQRLAMLEADTAVLKAILPRVETKIDEHVTETKASRQATNEKLDALIEQHNKAKGFALAIDVARQAVLFLAGIGGLKWLGFIR